MRKRGGHSILSTSPVEEVIQEFRALRKKSNLGDLDVREMIEEGRA